MASEESTWDGKERRNVEPKRWHVGKEIPLAFLVAMIVQTVVFVSWFSDRAARLEAKVDYVGEQMRDYRQERYTREDARRDQELMRQRDVEHERRLTALEASMDTLLRRK